MIGTLGSRNPHEATLDLDRRFLEWRKEPGADPEVWSRFRLNDSTLTWSDLLKRRRVVVLAEGGSGKSTEFKRQARLQIDSGQDAWYLTVQDVAEEGIEQSLSPADRQRFRAWKASKRSGWYFIDSIDEAKLNRIRLEKALRRIAADIAGAEGRAHLMISGRHTDWESERDLARLNSELPIPPDPIASASATADELLTSILRGEQSDEPAKAAETSLIAVMVPLDSDRVRRYAEGRGIPDVEGLIEHVERADLWQFARRPLDLDWLSDYWRRHKRLGTLAEMVETSLVERLKEVDPQRDRVTTLNASRAMAALERVGAALVFGRVATISIPDSRADLDSSDNALKLEEVLPDYSGPERADLITRPVFDPATFGRARLHNDNLGVVRAYLAARWLLRLRNGNLSRRALRSLIFGDTYDESLVLPSIRETAAWLSLWDADVAREVAKREPWVLLTGGDPGSVASDSRRAVLKELARRMVEHNFALPILDADSLKRFSNPDLADTVRELWFAHPSHEDLRSLLLRLIALGGLTACADLATGAAKAAETSRRLQQLAGRAVIAVADPAAKRCYAEYVVGHLTQLPNSVIWDAAEGLFPTLLSPDELLTITGSVDLTDTDGGLGFEWQGAELVGRLQSKADIEQTLRGFLTQLGGRAGSIGGPPDKRDDAFFPAVAALACTLLKLSPPEQAPALAVEAALRLGRERGSNLTSWKPVRELPALLLTTPERRRIAFWEAAKRFGDHPALRGGPLVRPYQMQMLGWFPGLRLQDLDWLLPDGASRAVVSERRLAVTAALDAAQYPDTSTEVLARIREEASRDPEMAAAFQSATTPRERSAEELESLADLEEAQRSNAAAQEERERGWRASVARLRADPRQLRDLLTPTEQAADPRLIDLWNLLSLAERKRNRYAFDSVSALEPILGPELSQEFRDALIRFWRLWVPRLASTRPPEQRNVINTLDCVGIAGITLEAHGDDAWATRLNSSEATRAASYATLELAQFPSWVSSLAKTNPDAVLPVVRGEISAELSDDHPGPNYKVLQDVVYSDSAVKALMAPAMLDELKIRSAIPEPKLELLLEVVLTGNLRENQRQELLEIALQRFRGAEEQSVAALYVGAAFGIDAGRATDALTARLDQMPEPDRKELVEYVLPKLFGDRLPVIRRQFVGLPFTVLVRMVTIAYTAVRVCEDRRREGGLAYSPDQRDRAEWARNAAFKTLVDTPGRATHRALHEFADIPDFPVTRERLTSIALERAAADSEYDPWFPGDAHTFETSKEVVPRTPLDLQRLALDRITDIQDQLLTGDFAQGRTVKRLEKERDVQLWVADRLELMQGSPYSVERESRVVNEKSPDVRLRARASSASVPIEVKVAESWTLPQLEAALTTQLCGQYLRAADARHGILLIVHQNPRSLGWEVGASGAYLNFEQVVTHLKAMAAEISATDPNAPQPAIAMLDVSGVEARK
jgi:hypothetical protein